MQPIATQLVNIYAVQSPLTPEATQLLFTLALVLFMLGFLLVERTTLERLSLLLSSAGTRKRVGQSA